MNIMNSQPTRQNANANAQSPYPLSQPPLSLNSNIPLVSSCSQSRHSRRPRFPYPLHVIPKLLARDPPPTLPPKRRMLVRIVKRILQQPHIRALHRPKHRLDLRIPQSRAHAPHRRSRRRRRGRSRGSCRSSRRATTLSCDAATSSLDASSAHVHYADHPHAGVGLEAIRREAVVDGVQEAKVARRSAGFGSQVEDVDCRGQKEGELQGVPDRREGVGGWVVGREDGDV